METESHRTAHGILCIPQIGIGAPFTFRSDQGKSQLAIFIVALTLMRMSRAVADDGHDNGDFCNNDKGNLLLCIYLRRSHAGQWVVCLRSEIDVLEPI